MTGHRSPVGLARLWLVRHAESEGNLADVRAQQARADRLELEHRDADVPLSEAGTQQARALGRAWRRLPESERPTVVVSSPYERALQTAWLAVETAGWPMPVERDERLRERDLGLLDGLTKHGIERQLPEEAARRAWVGKFYYRPPGGESWADVAGRVRAVLAERDRDGERLLLVTHQAVIMLVRYVVERLTEAQILDIDRGEIITNSAVTSYGRAEAGLSLGVFNDAGHLEEHDAPRTEQDEEPLDAR